MYFRDTHRTYGFLFGHGGKVKRGKKVKKKKENYGVAQVWFMPFSDAWRDCLHLFKRLYTSTDMMGMFNHHTNQEGDRFCVLEMKWFFVPNVQVHRRTKAKDLVKILADRTVSFFTVRNVLYQQRLKSQSIRRKSLLKIPVFKHTQWQRPLF